jgi:hypothetical protein
LFITIDGIPAVARWSVAVYRSVDQAATSALLYK